MPFMSIFLISSSLSCASVANIPRADNVTAMIPSRPDKESLLAKVTNTRFNRGGLYGSGVVGLKPFYTGKTPPGFEALYSSSELEDLQKLQFTERDVEARMPVKITDHYLNLALQSASLMNLVKAKPQETLDLSGSMDPSNQNKYSPVPGLLHKYEMVLLFVARTCSAHCRYCYRFDLFTNKSGKTVISSKDAAKYIMEYNAMPPSRCKLPITEALLSGGDPMVLPNTTLAEYFIDLAEAGVQTIRIGTKELAFFPYRFDGKFFQMLDLMHEAYPHVRLVFSLHFTHPAEFLKMQGGDYVLDDTIKLTRLDARNQINYKWLEVTDGVVKEFKKRDHVTLINQTPIIRKVNDNSEDLALLQKEMYRKGIGNHYIFQCRDIQGHREMAVPVEEAWWIFMESQRGLSGVEKSARFVMSTEKGKVEMVGLFHDQVVLRLHRSSLDTNNQNIVICKSNPDALWIDDYKDRVIFDPFKVI